MESVKYIPDNGHFRHNIRKIDLFSHYGTVLSHIWRLWRPVEDWVNDNAYWVGKDL
jgi:hypothetical protein